MSEVVSDEASDEAARQSPLATLQIGALAGHWFELVHGEQDPSIEQTGWPGSAAQSFELVQPGSHVPLLQNGVSPLQSVFMEHSGATQLPAEVHTLSAAHALGPPSPSSEHWVSVTQQELGLAFVQPGMANSARSSVSVFMSPLSAAVGHGCVARSPAQHGEAMA